MVANDSIPPPIGRASDDKQSPSQARKTTLIRKPVKLTLVVLGLALILIGLLTALQPHRLLFSPYINLASAILAGAGTVFLVLSASLLRVRRHWAHFLMGRASLCLMAACVAWLVLYYAMTPIEAGDGFVLFPMLLICGAAALIMSAICFVSALVVLCVKTDSTGTLQKGLLQRVALVGGSLVSTALIFQVVTGQSVTTGRPVILAHEIHGDAVTVTSCPIRASGEIVIPQNIENRPVTNIGRFAFRGCTRLTAITIPDGVTSVGDGAFQSCTSLTSITIPDGVTSIGQRTFRYCTGLTNIAIPDSVTSIGKEAFLDCENLTSITIPDGVTSIGGETFFRFTGLTNITIPDSVTSIGWRAFYHCRGLKSITIGDRVTSIGRYAFEGCTSLTSITIPDSVTSIGGGAFAECTNLETITIPDSVTLIGRNTFGDCRSLKNITIPDGVTIIEDYAFVECTSLTNVTIPESVTFFGKNAFKKCSNLSTVVILGDAPKASEEVFEFSSPTIYRKPEAKGWAETFGGRPVKMISEKP